MLKENPYLHSWDSKALIQTLTDYLHRPDVLLVLLIVCAGIALGALMKMWADLRRNKTRPRSEPTPGTTYSPNITNPFTGAAEPNGVGPADSAASYKDLGYSKPGRNKCLWQQDAIQPFSDSTRWICSTCKGFSFSSDAGPPTTCRAYEPRQKI